MIPLIIFWAGVSLIIYTYALFPVLILVRGHLLARPFVKSNHTPSVSVVIAAYNEEAHIGKRIENLLSQDYPLDRVQILIASDGSSDRTEAIVRTYEDRGVQLIAGPRRGKGQTLNAAVDHATGDFLVFSDANTHFLPDALSALVRPFADAGVGGVAGNQVYDRDNDGSQSASGERAYWNFDRSMKDAQSRAGSVTSATGAIYAIRRALYHSAPDYTPDDFSISIGVIAEGKRLVFAADAVAIEPVAASSGAEFARKVRYITQGLYAVRLNRALLNPLRFGFYSFQLAWHKILRRVMAFPLLAILAISPWLWKHGVEYQLVIASQVAFYGLVVLGFALDRIRPKSWKLPALAYYFFMVNAAALIAIVNNVRGRHVLWWTPSREPESGKPSP
jgi:cellulose synthase/poly-beta-1,6-N-acetylglucosamine synthase-like glycosyltransferase